MTKFVSLEEAKALVGTEVAVSDWFLVDQDRVNLFAEATGDFQYIHVDEERAAATPFGGTIAHGFLTLSLLSKLSAESDAIKISGAKMTINYGLDKVRFLNPVRVGKHVRARFTLTSAEEKSPGRYLIKHEATVEIEGEEKPALIAEWLGMTVT